jgi:hypothetical protein
MPPTLAVVTAKAPGLGSWSYSGVATAWLGSSALAIDATGLDHIVYDANPTISGTVYWTLSDSIGGGSAWTTSQIAQGVASTCIPIVAPEPAIAIDSAGTEHVLYNNCNDSHQHYAERASGQPNWQDTTLPNSAYGWPSAITVDSVGGLYAAVGSPDQLVDEVQILYGYRAPGLTWPSTFAAIDPAGSFATVPGTSAGAVSATSIAVDGSGTVYLAYATYLETSGAQTVFTQTVRVGIQPSGGGWSFTTLSTGTVAATSRAVSMVLSPSGVPHIAYVDAHGLHHAFPNSAGTGWTTETVDSSGSLAGGWIVVDSAGGVELTYQNSAPAYAYRCP